LNIVVCVKQTPDTAATVTIEDGKVSWGDAPLVLNPWDEFAVEEALQIKEEHGGQVTALSLGPEDAKEALKQSLAMGADEAILVSDPAFAGLDTLQVSKVLSAAIEKVGDVDLVLFGRSSVDSDTGLTGPQVARRLGMPSLSLVAKILTLDPGGKKIEVECWKKVASRWQDLYRRFYRLSRKLMSRATHRLWVFAKRQRRKYRSGRLLSWGFQTI
jgi:electron transfer flavoprotein beta subunit